MANELDKFLGPIIESTVKDMLDSHEKEYWRVLRYNYPDKTDDEIKIIVEEKRKIREKKEGEFRDKYERLCDDTVIGKVLELHFNDNGYCDGCDFSGYEAESPRWPCRTVDLILSNME